uniref:NADH dehydrogenase subunit 3 n=1 Tax=Gormaniella terricola TaxID=2904618 RepID=UPI0021CCA4CD|nr:NADH dehydrogenase subunit 3 [Gormaniella terricola]UWV18308.1 NADH dehydrogenase subunit 3 [Gormaniella terricola]
MSEYTPLLVYVIVAPLVTFLILFLNSFLSPRRIDVEKSMSYECGFDPFVDTRIPFDVGFYLVAILFLIFDIEVAFLLPWVIGFRECGVLGYAVMWFFMFVLLVGFYYEWKKGALEWN